MPSHIADMTCNFQSFACNSLFTIIISMRRYDKHPLDTDGRATCYFASHSQNIISRPPVYIASIATVSVNIQQYQLQTSPT